VTSDAKQDADALAAAEKRFDVAMKEIYESAGHDLGYWATRYLQMLRKKGGLATARYLLKAKTASDGYAHLRDSGRLDLILEAHVLRPEFARLFSPEELERARERFAYHEAAMRTEKAKRPPADPELVKLLGQVAAAGPADRIGYRDRVSARTTSDPGDPRLGRGRELPGLRLCRHRELGQERITWRGDQGAPTPSCQSARLGRSHRRGDRAPRGVLARLTNRLIRYGQGDLDGDLGVSPSVSRAVEAREITGLHGSPQREFVRGSGSGGPEPAVY
jgi:hypothetical protein